MDWQKRLIELGWKLLRGKAHNKACDVLGFDPGPNTFAQKFGRKTVFLRGDPGTFHLHVPRDRDDPSEQEKTVRSKVSMRWFDIDTVNEGARELLIEFEEITQIERGDASTIE